MFEEAIKKYLQRHGYDALRLRAVLFDMDGVLFNSMPSHAQAWHDTLAAFGHNLSCEEAYLHEGRTGSSTINVVYQRELGRDATEEEIEAIYQAKTEAFNRYPEAQPMAGARELMEAMKAEGLFCMLVTGSGQSTLIDRLNNSYPGIFQPSLMVTAFDVKYGKPNPEPYLMALRKGGLKPNEAIVVENAPLGVRAGVGAGIFTIAVNTGPLRDEVLLDEGANLLFPSMQALRDNWEQIKAATDNCRG